VSGLFGVLGLVWFLLGGIGNGVRGVPQDSGLAVMAACSVGVVMAMSASAVSLGGALGGGVGGIALAAGFTPGHLPLRSAAILAVTLPLHLLVARRPPARPRAQA